MNKINTTILILLLMGSHVVGENRKLAQTGFQFLSVIPDAYGAGQANALTASRLKSVSLFYNPAGLTGQKQFLDLSVANLDWIAGIKHTGISLSVMPRGGKFGVLGVSIHNVNYGSLQGTMVWDNKQGYIETEKFKPTALAIGLGYGKSLNDQLSVGGQVKSTFQYLGRSIIVDSDTTSSLHNNSVKSLAFDFGTIFDTGWKGFAFGMSVRNFSEEIEFYEESFQLPLTFRLGSTILLTEFSPLNLKNQAMKLSFDLSHPRSFDEQFNVGFEYSLFNMIFLRTGYLMNYDERGLTAGAGFNKKLKTMTVGINYAYTPFGVFDTVSRLSVNFGFK
jgi:hypothetical protein